MRDLLKLLKKWGVKRGIDQCDPLLQTTKTEEEINELEQAIIGYEEMKNNFKDHEFYVAKEDICYNCKYFDPEDDDCFDIVNGCYYKEINNTECKYLTEIKDAIGDIFVTLVMLSIQECDIHRAVFSYDSYCFEDVDSIKIPKMLRHDLSILQMIYKGEAHTPEDYPMESMIALLNAVARNYNFNLKECIRYAYDQIKDRKGSIVNGLWRKSND